MSTLKHLREIRALVRELGGEVEREVEGKHVKMYVAFGQKHGILVLARSPSDRRTDANTRRDILRIKNS